MSNIEQNKKDYLQGKFIDCPHCGADYPEHVCQHCLAKSDHETCFALQGYCSVKCKEYIEIILPKQRKEKQEMGVKCKCDIEHCMKCFISNCQDDNCPTHDMVKKEFYRRRYNRK